MSESSLADGVNPKGSAASTEKPSTALPPASQPASLQEEIGELYSTLAGSLLHYAKTFRVETATAQDAVQETFLRYFIHRSGGKHLCNEKAWLFKVLRNLLLDYGRGAYAHGKVGLEKIAHSMDPRQNPEANLVNREKYQKILGELSDRELECIRLREEGFDYQEIADLMGIRKGTVGVLLARAIQKIQKQKSGC